jgi:hypothetical protein
VCRLWAVGGSTRWVHRHGQVRASWCALGCAGLLPRLLGAALLVRLPVGAVEDRLIKRQ